jgi:hypothetical protein
MINTGDCKGGDLVVGTHNQQVRRAYLPGNIVMFRSSLLKHGITPFQGRRTAVVLFTRRPLGVGCAGALPSSPTGSGSTRSGAAPAVVVNGVSPSKV